VEEWNMDAILVESRVCGWDVLGRRGMQTVDSTWILGTSLQYLAKGQYPSGRTLMPRVPSHPISDRSPEICKFPLVVEPPRMAAPYLREAFDAMSLAFLAGIHDSPVDWMNRGFLFGK